MAFGILEPEFSPIANGFDYFYRVSCRATDYISHITKGKPDLYENDQPVQKEGYITEFLWKKLLRSSAGLIQNPFFLASRLMLRIGPGRHPEINLILIPDERMDNWKAGGSASYLCSHDEKS